MYKQYKQFQLSSRPIFGHDDNSNCHRDQIFVTMTKNWSRDNSNCHRDQIFCHRDQIFVTMTKNWSRDKKLKKTERKALDQLLERPIYNYV